jgi:pyruvate dehydrogenase E2 component (dihydrolipoamide acetyltransferase)
MPALGMSQETGKIIAWLKRDGETVDAGEPLLEVETDKATAEIEAPVSGTLSGISAVEGDDIPVGQQIAIILQPGDPIEEGESVEEVGSPHVLPRAGNLTELTESQKMGVSSQEQGGGSRAHGVPRLKTASPKARRMAKERHLELASIVGTGPDGAVIARDLEGHSISLPEAPPEPDGQTESIYAPQRETLDMSRNWRVMAERLSKGWVATPHFYLRREVKISEFIRWREEINSHASVKVTFTDMLVRAVASSLSRHPRLNASWKNDLIEVNHAINIGIAVGTEDGLVVPVLHGADKLTFIETARRRTELVARAKSGQLTADDLSNGTFTISNLGMFGVDNFDPIVNPPQAAILAVGRTIEKLFLIDDKVAVRPVWNLTLACDHRVVDGVRGAEFFQSLVELIEEPIRFFI